MYDLLLHKDPASRARPHFPIVQSGGAALFGVSSRGQRERGKGSASQVGYFAYLALAAWGPGTVLEVELPWLGLEVPTYFVGAGRIRQIRVSPSIKAKSKPALAF